MIYTPMPPQDGESFREYLTRLDKLGLIKDVTLEKIGTTVTMTGMRPTTDHLIKDGVKPLVHFVGFRDPQRFMNAQLIFGPPDVVHYVWDQRAQREIVLGWDTVVFAKGSAD